MMHSTVRERRERKSRKLFLCVYFRPSRKKETEKILKILKNETKSTSNPSCVFFGVGLDYT